MFDWNGNGREDWGDRYIDYEIYNDICNSDDDNNSNQPSGNEGAGCGCMSPLLMVFLVFLIWNLMTN